MRTLTQGVFGLTLAGAVAIGGVLGVAADAEAAQRGGGHKAVRASASGNVNRGGGANRNVNRGGNANRNVNHNVNRNTNVNRNANVNVNRDIDVDVHGHGGCCFDDDWDHPFATAAAVTAGVAVTSAVIGSIVNSVPPSCVQTIINGIAYQQCGSTWYQPQYAGTTVQYVVVNPPG